MGSVLVAILVHKTKFYKVMSQNFKAPKMKIHVVDFANSVDSDEVAHNEPPHLDLHYLPCGF